MQALEIVFYKKKFFLDRGKGKNNETRKLIYIGQTKNTLGKRIKQHKYDVTKDNTYKTALTAHVKEYQNTMDFNKYTSTNRHRNNFKKKNANETYNFRKNTEQILNIIIAAVLCINLFHYDI